MSILINSSPSPNSGIVLSKDSADYRVRDTDSLIERVRLYLFLRDGADYEEVYAEERVAEGSDFTVFKLGDVLSSLLEYEFPSAGQASPYQANLVMKQYYLVSPRRFRFESQSTHTYSSANSFEPLPFTMQAGKFYRISAAYREDYSSSNNRLLDSIAGRANPFFTNNKEWIDNGRVVEVIQAPFDYDKIMVAFDNWDIKISEVPIDLQYALKAGIGFKESMLTSDYFDQASSLLTTAPQRRPWMDGQEGWLWKLYKQAKPSNTASCIVNYKDGTTHSFVYDFQFAVIETTVIALPLAPVVAEAKLQDSSKTMHSLSIFIAEGVGYESIELYFAYEGLPYLREFHFNNRLGGTDWLIAYGKGQQEDEWSHEEFRQFAEPAQRQFSKRHFADRSRFSVSAGYRSKAERDAAYDLLRSELAYIREDGQLLPINVLSAKTQREKDGDRRYTLTFDYVYAFEN